MHDAPRPVVVFSGGGTGGHLYPALALADALLEVRPDARPFFVGASRGVEARILPERGAEYALLPVEGFQRGRGVASIRAVPALGRSVLRVVDLFHGLRPEVVVVTGGYAGGPAGIVAGMQRIPLVLQEQNAVPGATTRLLSRWARQVHLAFPEAADRLPARARAAVRMSGNPVRPSAPVPRESARAALGLPTSGLILLVVGGSQGSDFLNRTVLGAVEDVCRGVLQRPEGLSLVWSTGPKHHPGVMARLGAAGHPSWVQARPYIDDMPTALAAADLAVSRAGAMATAELLNQGLPSVLVPLPSAAANHQARNAEALVEAGAALLAPEAGLTGAGLWAMVARLATDEAARERMGAAARGRARPEAARDIATEIARFLPARAA